VIILSKNSERQKILIDIIKFILAKEMVHYSDIIEHTHKARKTVARYLDELDRYLQTLDIDVQLVRKRNVGIYFHGDVAQLRARYSITQPISSKEERLITILLYLINSKEYRQLYEIADELFISKSTLEKDLDILKKSYGLRIQSNSKGILVKLSEAEIRSVIGNVVRDNLEENLTYNEKTDGYHLHFTVPKELMNYIDQRHLQKVQDTLGTFLKASDQKITEYEYESLLVHTAIALQRIMDGDYLEDKDFKLGKLQANTHLLVALLEKNFAVKIPQIEQGYLNLHILAIEGTEVEFENDPLLDEGLREDLKHYLVEYDETLLKNLLLHLTLAIKRKKQGIEIKNPYQEAIMQEFPEAVDQAQNLLTSLSFKYHTNLSKAEVTYIALHLQSFKERQLSTKTKDKKLAIVCSTGYGTSAFLKQRLQHALGDKDLQIQNISVEQLTTRGTDADLIVSTIPIKTKAKNVIQVSPLISSNEIALLEKAITSLDDNVNKKMQRAAFMSVIDRECILIDNKTTDVEGAIELVVKKLNADGYVDQNMLAAALKREHLASTDLGKVAIPHGDIDHVKKSIIGILINENGIAWGNEKVKVVFFVALNKAVSARIDDIYSYFYDLISDDRRVEKLAKLQTKTEVFNYLRKWN